MRGLIDWRRVQIGELNYKLAHFAAVSQPVSLSVRSRMNQTFFRRVGMALGMWRFLRYQSQLCRWFPLTIAPDNERAGGNELEVARWLGKIQIAGRAHHALFVPPGS